MALVSDHEELGLGFSELEVMTKNGLRRVLVATPVADLRLDRERLIQMRAGELGSRLDDALVETLAASTVPVHGLIFRAMGDQPGHSWCFADELSTDEADEMAHLFVRSHVALFRRLLEHGVVLLVGVDFGPRELAAYRHGTETLATELERGLVGPDEAAAQRARLDLWLAERQAYWTPTPFAEYVQAKLADALVTAERQLARFERLASEST